MTRYVAGFLFDEKRSKVALIQKARPQWQAGFLNGIGGHIEEGETPMEAMIREFNEETGALVPFWQLFATVGSKDNHDGWAVHFFRTRGDYILKSLTDEPVAWFSLDQLSNLPIISNLNWLIPLALDETTDLVTALSA